MASTPPSESDAPIATTTPDDGALAESERIKLLANKEFGNKNYAAAIELYSQAIDKNPRNAILFANRSACHLAIENYGTAIIDATSAIELDPTYQKGYYRRGAAHAAMAKYKLALDDFRELVRIAPSNKEARTRLKACETAFRREKFQEAIASSYSIPPSERLDPNAITIDPSYDGLHMPETLTPEWVESLMESFVNQQKLHLKYCYQLLFRAKEIFKAQPTVVDITVPEGGVITVFGDVHGQYYDLVNILRNHSGLPSPTNPLVFNGDLVDRGSWSLEVILLLLAYKVLYPEHVHIARGNHETKSMNMVYGFTGEVKAKYNSDCMELFTEIFCYLPLVHLINRKVFITHGGLFSQDDVTLEQLRKINRFQEPPDRGLMSELLWSDPRPGALPGRVQSKRGVGIEFGVDVTTRFCELNGLDLIVRSHEVRQEGYSVEHNGKLITVFSAPNYCDQAGNKAAIIRFDSNMQPTFVTFSHVPHPNVRPMQYANDYQSLIM